MTKAYRCDVCDKFKTDEPVYVQISPSDVKMGTAIYDVCPDCIRRFPFNDIKEIFSTSKTN